MQLTEKHREYWHKNLVITGILLSIDDGGPMLTGNVPAFAFLGSVVGLGGLLLLLRSLRTALPRRTGSG